MKYRLRSLIEQVSEKCGVNNHENISGINIQKRFMPSKNSGADTSKYKIVDHNQFACNLMHVGRDEKIPIALNDNNDEIVVSPAYTVFKVTDTRVVNINYLNMVFTSPEFDRYAWYCTDASIRGNLGWDRFCDIEIDLPPLAIQEKYVAVYQAMLANQKAYENGLEDLKLVCDATIEKLRRELPSEAIGKYIELTGSKNIEGMVTSVRGVESTGNFMITKAKMAGIDITKYSIVNEREIAYNPSRINLGSVALCKEKCIVSPMYVVFDVIDKSSLLPEYLIMWLSRRETHRYTLFKAMGSVRDTFDFSLMREFEIPIPDIHVQQSIVDIYNAYTTRKDINERLKQQIKDICPILIAGAIKEANENA